MATKDRGKSDGPREATEPTGRDLAAARTKLGGKPATESELAARVDMAKTKARKPREMLLPSEPLVTAERALAHRRRDPIVASFLHGQKLGSVRKLSRSDWAVELEAFIKAPR